VAGLSTRGSPLAASPTRGSELALTGETPDGLISRFGRGSRQLHWTHAVLFLVLLLTGASLLLPSTKGFAIGGSRLLPSIHIAAGVLFILSPVLVYLTAADRALVHRDLRRLVAAGRDDVRWLWWAGLTLVGFRRREPLVGKFNAGQKLNTLYTVATGLGLIVTGMILVVHTYKKGLFDVNVAQRVFTLHDALMFATIPVVAIHIYLAVFNPGTRESLRGIVRGAVRIEWARRHHPKWVEDDDRRGHP
jgi:formate dehydrogenase subunit gamma